MLPELLAQIPADQEIAGVTADGAYDTRKCHDAIAERGAHAASGILSNRWRSCPPPAPQERQAVEDCHGRCHCAQRGAAGVEIPRTRALATMERLPPQKPRRNQDALCEPKDREAKLLGQRLMARDFDRQVAEFPVRVAVLNGYTALSIPVTTVTG